MSESMKAEVIAFGDELTSGGRLDTNSQWLSQKLEALGVQVVFHTTVGDDLAAAAMVLKEAFQRVEVVVATGGLGPTADDLTRQAVAEATSRPLFRNQEALRHIRTLFARRLRTMPEQNKVQADFPQGSSMIDNPHGTAPGIHMEVGEGAAVQVFLLPGVPAEMRQMWSSSVEPALVDFLGPDRRFIQHHLIHCFGAGESAVESMLPDLIRRGRQPSVGITASQATITLRLAAEADSLPECNEMVQSTAKVIRDSLGDLVFGENNEQLPEVVVRALAEREKSLAIVEYGTGGLVGSWLAEAARGQPCFAGGMIVADSPAQRAAWSATCDGQAVESPADDFDPAQCGVAAMAESVKRQFRSDYGLAVGPFPVPSHSDEMAQSVHFALAGPGQLASRVIPFAGHPAIIRTRFAKEALNMIRLELLTRESL